jgi:hypothetical protein
VTSLSLGKIRLAEQCLVISHCMNMIYVVGNERASSPLFEGVISIM